MQNLETIITKHGEIFVQAILEDWEQAFQVKHPVITPLEQRWATFWNSTAPAAEGMAA
jgi:hypothetical protein